MRLVPRGSSSRVGRRWHRVADVGAGAMQVHWWRVCGAGKRRGGVVGVRHAIGIWVCMSVGE